MLGYAISVSALLMSSSARSNGLMAYIQLTTPSEPVSAVSTAMRILRSLLQFISFSISFHLQFYKLRFTIYVLFNNLVIYTHRDGEIDK